MKYYGNGLFKSSAAIDTAVAVDDNDDDDDEFKELFFFVAFPFVLI